MEKLIAVSPLITFTLEEYENIQRRLIMKRTIDEIQVEDRIMARLLLSGETRYQQLRNEREANLRKEEPHVKDTK